MKKLLSISLLAILISFTSCNDDMEDAETATENNAVSQTSNIDAKKMTHNLNGISFDLDSATNFALGKYNQSKINEIAKTIIEKLLKQNKKVEYKNELEEVYGYSITNDIWDTLKLYNFDKNDISFVNHNSEIYLSGKSPYKEQGTFENTTFNCTNLEIRHPELYKKAQTLFFIQEKPIINDLTIENQSSGSIEYSAKVKFSTLSEQYILFSVNNINQKIVVRLDKSSL